LNRFRAPDSLEFALLQHPQQSNLRFGWQVTNLVEKRVPPSAASKLPMPAFESACEGAFFMSAELRSYERGRNCDTIYAK
jgi:hypothetical protein